MVRFPKTFGRQISTDGAASLLDKFNERAQHDANWAIHLKNVFSAMWPLFLYSGIVLLLLVYLESKG